MEAASKLDILCFLKQSYLNFFANIDDCTDAPTLLMFWMTVG
jgi:hypothetical protein